MSEAERIASLEALQSAHEQRHGIFDRELEKTFQSIDKRFDNIDTKLQDLHIDILSSTKSQPMTNGKKARNVIIKVGTPMLTGGGIVAIIMWCIEHLI